MIILVEEVLVDYTDTAANRDLFDSQMLKKYAENFALIFHSKSSE